MIADDERQDPGGFDPRYDPAFQRGYRPQPGERTRTRVRSTVTDAPFRRPDAPQRREEAASEAPAAPASAAPAFWSPAEEPALDAPYVVPPGEEPRVVAGPMIAARVEPGGSLLDRVELSPRRNPLMLALWLVGAGFVVLGIVLYYVSVTTSYGTPNGSDVGALVFTQLGWMLAGPLITIGLATLVALLFVTAFAVRRPAEPSGSDRQQGSG